MTLDDWKIDMGSVTEMVDALPTPQGEEDAMAPPPPVYRWQDESGQWHFSNTPPEAVQAELVEIGAVNVMQSIEVPDAEPSREVAAPPASIPDVTAGVSADQVKEMMDTVNNLQDTLNARQSELDQINP